jgi:hypothetical protein
MVVKMQCLQQLQLVRLHMQTMSKNMPSFEHILDSLDIFN